MFTLNWKNLEVQSLYHGPFLPHAEERCHHISIKHQNKNTELQIRELKKVVLTSSINVFLMQSRGTK